MFQKSEYFFLIPDCQLQDDAGFQESVHSRHPGFGLADVCRRQEQVGPRANGRRASRRSRLQPPLARVD